MRKQAAQSLGRLQSQVGSPFETVADRSAADSPNGGSLCFLGLLPGAAGTLLDRLQLEQNTEVRAQIIQSLGRVCNRALRARGSNVLK